MTQTVAREWPARFHKEDASDKIDAALERDLSVGRSFPVHGAPSFRILLHGIEIFADHDETEKILPTIRS